MSTQNAAYFASTAFCIVAFILVICQVYRNANKLRVFVLLYSLFALPSSILNSLTARDPSLLQADTIMFMITSILKVVFHFGMIISVGYKLRTDNLHWRHPLILGGTFFLVCTMAALLAQTIYVAIVGAEHEIQPLKISFVIGLICAIITDVLAFIYTFLPLIHWKKEKRSTEGLSKTTALGIWFFVTQGTFYIIQVALYIWFVSINHWEYFILLLAVDYVIRFTQYLFYIWPPPDCLIGFLASRLLSVSVHTSVEVNQNGVFKSSERYTKMSSA
ncbi:hypothetical protein G6F56_008657 [Rhizopus delemar]|nr:hypothetical protein G6F56_008657 [Rhizopus delemar]